jgi:putative phosphoesterase
LKGDPAATAQRIVTVGLISDTHGLLRPEALECLRGSDLLIHAGDIGEPEILDTLAGMAPLTVVRGNNDTQPWARRLPHSAVLRVAGASIYVIHDLAGLTVNPAQNGFQAVVAGHSHRPAAQCRDGVWFVNPGSAGPRRFRLPVSVGRLSVGGKEVFAQLIELRIDAGHRK